MTHALATRAVNPDKPYGNVDYADPGFQDDGKARYPLDSEQHVRAAWSYINQADNADQYTPQQLARIRARIMTAGKRYGITFADISARDLGDNDDDPRSSRLAVCTRSYQFEMRSVSHDGRQLVGRVAVFNTPARIPDRGGDFDERILPGFADRSLRNNGYPVMQFDHGKDPRTGTVPIGRYDVFDNDGRGYAVEGELFDNPVVEPVRQAIAGRAIKGMSFRFTVTPNGGDRWERRNGQRDLRHVIDADVPEAGPVVFPAYRDTAVAVRSILATFDEDEREEAVRELRQMAGLTPEDLTGQSYARSDDGGEFDAESWEDDVSAISPEARQRQLDLLRPALFLP
jgi:phage head maturation protease